MLFYSQTLIYIVLLPFIVLVVYFTLICNVSSLYLYVRVFTSISFHTCGDSGRRTGGWGIRIAIHRNSRLPAPYYYFIVMCIVFLFYIYHFILCLVLFHFNWFLLFICNFTPNIICAELSFVFHVSFMLNWIVILSSFDFILFLISSHSC